MTEYKIGDRVEYERKGKISCGIVKKILEDELVVSDFFEEKLVFVKIPKAALVTPVYVDAVTFQKFARYEIGLSDLNEGNYCKEIINKDNYVITLYDILCAAKKWFYEEKDDEKFMSEWLDFFEQSYSETEYDEDNDVYTQRMVFCELLEAIWGAVYLSEDEIFIDTISEAESFIEDSKMPFSRRRIPDYAKIRFIQKIDREESLEQADDETVELYRKFSLELYKKENVVGLNAVGYGSYGGNRAFPCDWKLSESCMLKLLEKDESDSQKAYYANTLGYIYYYGRCNNGVPEYDKAYKYFSFAAFSGVYEALYKVSDMLKNGYGVAKSIPAAKKIVADLYEENLKHIQSGNFNSKFADIAFRMGNFIETNELGDYFYDVEAKLKYYYQADFAIRMRMINHESYGDRSVKTSIQSELEKLKNEIEFEAEKKVIVSDISWIFDDYISNGETFDVRVKPLANNKCKLTFKLHKKANEKFARRMFITIPSLNMCGFYNDISVTVTPLDGYERTFMNGIIEIDEIYDDMLCFDGQKLMDLDSCNFEIKSLAVKSKKYRFASVKFNDEGRSYSYLCEDETIQPGDKVKLISHGEEKYVTVRKLYEKAETELYLPLKSFKKI